MGSGAVGGALVMAAAATFRFPQFDEECPVHHELDHEMQLAPRGGGGLLSPLPIPVLSLQPPVMLLLARLGPPASPRSP